ncbi:ShlB/FhaC/HecB family hemolysin secretion/activation protein [Thiobacillus sp.]|uniref:ShlB/FhaC/HecB family hemolysin secretion/activation protein n=1 Tax=Thiobacillus sp. TaxID=924 RepID=UPI00286E70AB|nr:ShlB/FhaC/HecB family hemolysin secretion/activation protein [Thiobacillus sp.]
MSKLAQACRGSRSRAVWVLPALLVAFNPAARAVDVPTAGAVQQLERQQIERLQQERRLRQQPVKPDISLPAAPAAEAASTVKNIQVKTFRLDESAILGADEIRAVLAPYENQTLSLADLMGAVDALNALYQSKNMPTARAFLPPQEIRDGVVSIRLVEARVGAITLGEAEQISTEFVTGRMNLARGDLMSVHTLEEDLVRFNRLHEVQLHASVQPGTTAGTTDLLLTATEPRRYQYSVFADNAGRYTVGEERLGFVARALGLTGRGDSLLFSAFFSEGSESYYLGYSTPLTADDLKLDVSYNRGSIEVVEGAFVPLDVGGSSSDLTVGLTQPLIVNAQELLNLYGRMASKESISEFGNVTQLDLDLMVLSVGISGDRQQLDSVLTYDLNLNQGVKYLGGEASFFAVRANAAWLGRYGTRSQLILRGGMQYSPTDLLPASEQFQLGGSASVRGYSEGLLSGRSGYLLSAEWRYALQNLDIGLPQGPDAPLFSAIAFVDHGGAFPYRPSPLDDVTQHDFLTGAGVGVLLDWKGRVTGRLAVAWPLTDNPAEAEQRKPRLHAAISYNWL